MGQVERGSTLVLLLVLLVCRCHGSRNSQSLQVAPARTRNSEVFMGFLPKAMPLPPSGPSRQHNVVGLRSQQAP
ncbi:unnamed protein product [Spirodela intermedia]|uniref:Uncharacterized protein n=1 Tax=Spirodela intermedia TaxID=51605 RepID=A0A7I8L7M9_SPIIN|nr:unnamed protein product [Spirodela intermedia]